MAKRRPVIPATYDSGPAVSAERVPLHEGPAPDPRDGDAVSRWLQVRHARFAREVGGPRDPRHALVSGATPGGIAKSGRRGPGPRPKHSRALSAK
jgi:hypothetical protein